MVRMTIGICEACPSVYAWAIVISTRPLGRVVGTTITDWLAGPGVTRDDGGEPQTSTEARIVTNAIRAITWRVARTARRAESVAVVPSLAVRSAHRSGTARAAARCDRAGSRRCDRHDAERQNCSIPHDLFGRSARRVTKGPRSWLGRSSGGPNSRSERCRRCCRDARPLVPVLESPRRSGVEPPRLTCARSTDNARSHRT